MADGTLIFYLNQMDEGTRTTKKLCTQYLKFTLEVKLYYNLIYNTIRTWIEENNIRILNVAGPRESNDPGIYSATLKNLKNLFDYSRKI